MDAYRQIRLYNYLVRRSMRRQRVIRDKLNPFEAYDDKDFLIRYRFRKDTVLFLMQEVRDELEPKYEDRSTDLTPEQQVIVALRFYATGSFQKVVGDTVNITQPSVCRIIHRVSRAIASRRPRYVVFPGGDELSRVKGLFYDLYAFPNIVGAIDCTHVRICSPGGNEAARFINRKGYSSINVQMIRDADLKVLNIVARWPGSAHDSRIFDNSEIKDFISNLTPRGFLLGDMGYPCLPCLMTPLRNPITDSENCYNKAHIKARNTVERLFGVIKSRFPALQYTLRTSLEHTLVIIVAVVVLYNIGLEHSDRPEDDWEAINTFDYVAILHI